MPSLREMQAGFAQALFDPAASRAAPGICSDGLSPSTRLGLYRTNVFENYRKALGAIYPALEAVVGRGCFGHLAAEYTRGRRSISADVGQQGSRFADFLERHPLSANLPYLPDLARLEWAIEESFHEADHGPLSLEALMAVDEALYPELRFSVAPSCRLFESRFPVHRIWEMSQPGTGRQERVDLDAGGVQLIVRRDRYEVLLEPATPAQFAMLRALQTGYGFGEALAYALSVEESFDPGAFLQRYVAGAVLCGFTLPAEVHAPARCYGAFSGA